MRIAVLGIDLGKNSCSVVGLDSTGVVIKRRRMRRESIAAFTENPQVQPGAHAALICDGAGWHQPGKRLRVPHNITLMPLPPYAPDLNPMENVWHYLRANKLSLLVWDSYDAIVSACKDAWDFLISDPDRIRSIGTRAWAYLHT
jgi:transposase